MAGQRFGPKLSSTPGSASIQSTIVGGRSAHSEYMDLSGQDTGQQHSQSTSLKQTLPAHGPHFHGANSTRSGTTSASSAAPAGDSVDGEYVSLDMSRPWQTRSLSLCDAPEPKKCKSELTATMSVDVPMSITVSSSATASSPANAGPSTSTFTTTQHNYENLSFGANGVTVDAVSSLQDSNSQEPMDTDQPASKGPPSTPAPTPERGPNSPESATTQRILSSLLGQPVSPPPTPVPSPGVSMQVVPGRGTLSTLNAVCHELNYASLDLPPASEEPSSPGAGHEAGSSGIVPPSLSLPNGLAGPASTGVSYSEVDFRKSEGLRGSMLREGGRV